MQVPPLGQQQPQTPTHRPQQQQQQQHEPHQSPNKPTTPTSAHQTHVLSNSAKAARKNFHHHEKIDATEQPDEMMNETANSDAAMVNSDNSQAAICNEAEYNRIFRPQKELGRVKPEAKPTTSFANCKKAHPMSPKSNKNKDEVKEQDFFIDIKVSTPPQQPASQQVAVAAPSPLSPKVVSPPPVVSAAPPQHQQQAPPSKSISAYEISSIEKKKESNKDSNLHAYNLESNNKKQNDFADKFDKVNINDFVPVRNVTYQLEKSYNSSLFLQKAEMEAKFETMDLASIIETGHVTFMKAITSRARNLQTVRSMWSNGNIRVR